MSKRAADFIVQEIQQHPNSSLGLATGSTPLGLYKELINSYIQGKADFSKVSTYNLDEYYPIQKVNPQSYDHFMNENLFRHINVEPSRIHIPNGEHSSAEGACLAYDEELRRNGPLTLQLLGIGLNGHIGFNEPGDCFAGSTWAVDLSLSTIEANSRFFEDSSQVPKRALTMGIKDIMQANKILLVVSGAQKADILQKSLYGPITHACTGFRVATSSKCYCYNRQ
ncbi:glucosamine-6-phosphate isomerase [Holotrichia oblita]|nr:glucosamine-6-phosphate isomerase [Holotrichia oblita]